MSENYYEYLHTGSLSQNQEIHYYSKCFKSFPKTITTNQIYDFNKKLKEDQTATFVYATVFVFISISKFRLIYLIQYK